MKFSPYMVTHFPKTDTKINNLILPLKIGYNFHITERFCLMPSIGLYAAYGFSAGNSSLEIVQPDGEGARTETHQWNPIRTPSKEARTMHMPFSLLSATGNMEELPD